MRQVDDDAWNGIPDLIDHRLVSRGFHLIVAVEKGRCREQGEMFAALDEEPVEKHVVEPLGRGQRVSYSLTRVFVEIQASGSERQIEVHDRGIDAQLFSDVPADIVGNGRGPGAAARAGKSHHAADGRRLWVDVEI